MMLEVEHLSYDIHEEGRQSEILSDISFSVEDGEMLVITGPVSYTHLEDASYCSAPECSGDPGCSV